ncbi:MAG TPA: LAGLIDADG family homing endonuclease [Candidatus Babeliaceae bacterium]|nr:LAGLIDADG family homing endonuclease [Candidatus Babeliaceae bacterium]
MSTLAIETKIHLNQFKPRSYQLPVCKVFEEGKIKKFLIVNPRRSGKDYCWFALMIREAIRRPGLYLYCLPTFSQCRSVVFEGKTNTGSNFLDMIPPTLIAKIRQDTMTINLVNGSIIRFVGSDSYDTSIIGSNPRMIVFSEYALCDENAYKLAAMPILRANDGIVALISCVNPETLVISQEGFQRIQNISKSREEYSELNKKIYGISGFHNAEQFYYGGKQETLIITLESGYEIECTRVHKIWNGSQWIVSNDLKVGDLIPIQYDQNIWGKGITLKDFSYSNDDHWALKLSTGAVVDRADKDVDFWYLLGLIHADGNYTKNAVTVTKKKDKQIQDFLVKEGFRPRKDGIHFEFSSRLMCAFLEHIGFKHGALNKTFPDKLLSLRRDQMIAFLQGVFDGDGCSHATRGTVKLTSVCKKFIKDLQVILLNFGICSSVYREEKEPTELVKIASVIYNLEITGTFAARFYFCIGFRLERKQRNHKMLKFNAFEEPGIVCPIDIKKLNGYKLTKSVVKNPSRITRRLIKKLNKDNPHPYLQEVLKEKLFYSPIKSIQSSSSEVFDFVIPDTHSFFSNGFLSHNTPRGKNHMYELFQIAQNNPDWYTQFLTIEETGHISVHEVRKEIESGEISEDLAQQEYWCSFEMGQEGSYYAKYIDKMRLRGQIGVVPWEPYHKVHTAWDLGIKDSTVIIFFQIIGETVRIIDYYEASDRGMDHFAQLLTNKGYIYGHHFPPHDIMVRELSRGLSRREMYAELGVKFTEPINIGIEDGIELVRRSLSKIWIDEIKCKKLIKALENYREEFDIKRKVYKGRPLHDWASHAADAMRYLCAALPKTKDGLSPEKLDKIYHEAMSGGPQLPKFFNEQNY